MNSVRIGIIGMGNMGKFHAADLLAGKVPRATLAAVGSTSPGKLSEYAQKGVQVFGTSEEMIASRCIDALLIATPHPQHPPQGIAAFEAGLHVTVEKPIASHKADAERLIAVARAHPKQVFAAMFQLRVEPRYMKIRQLIQSGELGKLVRVVWIMTDWFRSEAYYQSGGWRATWKGEGGGVLLNQCLHQLDALQWMVGMPARLQAHIGLGRHHDIEVEDDVTCHLEFPSGATGAFISSTGETPGSNRLEIAGTKGRLILENDKLILTRNAVPTDEWCRTSKIGFKKPDTTVEEIPIPPAVDSHAQLMTNFVNAVLDGAALIAPGADGLHSVELANAMLFSGLVGRSIDLPMDSAAYEAQLNALIAASKKVKTVVEVSAEDFAASFRR